MVKLVCGERGAGKTKKLIDMSNSAVETSKGDIVFISDNNKHMLDIKRDIRFVNAMDFDINDIETFHGFLCGMIAEDYDIENIYIDRLYKMIDFEKEQLGDVVNRLEKLEDKFKTNFTISMRLNESELPEDMKSRVI